MSKKNYQLSFDDYSASPETENGWHAMYHAVLADKRVLQERCQELEEQLSDLSSANEALRSDKEALSAEFQNLKKHYTTLQSSVQHRDPYEEARKSLQKEQAWADAKRSLDRQETRALVFDFLWKFALGLVSGICLMLFIFLSLEA